MSKLKEIEQINEQNELKLLERWVPDRPREAYFEAYS